MSKTDDSLNSAFDLVPTSNEPKSVQVVPHVDNTEELEKSGDRKLAKESLRTVLKLGDTVLHEVAQLASDTEHPNAYKAVAEIMKQLKESAVALNDISSVKEEKERSNINVEKGVFFEGTPAQLLERMKQDGKV